MGKKYRHNTTKRITNFGKKSQEKKKMTHRQSKGMNTGTKSREKTTTTTTTKSNRIAWDSVNKKKNDNLKILKKASHSEKRTVVCIFDIL